MPEIVGHFPLEEDPSRQVPCVLCLEPTSTRAAAPGLGEGVELPLHVFCAGWLVVAYRRAGEGRLTDGMRRQLDGYAVRVARMIGPGTDEELDPEAEVRP